MDFPLAQMDAAAIGWFAIIGAVTGLIRDLVWYGGLKLPRREKTQDGERLVRLGFIGSMLIGAFVAAVVDGSITTAIGWALAGPEAVERLANAGAASRRRSSNKKAG